MIPFKMVRTPARLAGWALHKGPRGLIPRRSELGQVGVVNPEERSNLIKVTTGVAMAAGGIYALLNVPTAKKVTQVALGLGGGALVVAGLLNLYDGIA